MKQNMVKVLERDDKLTNLEAKSKDLEQSANRFFKAAAALKRKFMWKNVKMILLVTGVVVLVVGVIVLTIVF